MQDTVRDTAVERLSKLITDSRDGGGADNNKDAQSHKPAFHIHLSLDEGWFSLILLTIVVYSTIWSVQAVNWVDHLNVLTLTTLLGLVAGVVAAKQYRFPVPVVHVVALSVALLIAFWQTAGAFDGGNTAQLAHGMHQWFASVINGGTGEDDSIFLFLITLLGFLLAYSSAWLVYRTRSPWLMIVANAVVLLISLSIPGIESYLSVVAISPITMVISRIHSCWVEIPILIMILSLKSRAMIPPSILSR